MKKEHSEDYLQLFEFAKEWVKVKFAPFTIEDIKADYLKKHNVINNCYRLPNIIKRIEELGLIKYNDKLVKSKAKGSKGRYVKEWISKVYSEKQSKKRLSEETAKSRELEKSQTKIEL